MPSPQHRPASRRHGWCVYVLRCADGSLYTGVTNDLERRVAVHGTGRGAAYTRSRRPVTLVHVEPVVDRGAALRREAAIKRLTRAQKLVVIRKARATGRKRRGSAPVDPRPGRTSRGGRAMIARPPPGSSP